VPSAKEFANFFIKSYQEVRQAVPDKQRWIELLTPSGVWTDVMLCHENPPSPVEKSVLKKTAEKAGLRYVQPQYVGFKKCEPLRLDAVFCKSENIHHWFPIAVAIEHENSKDSFDDEVVKLLSVRCPLRSVSPIRMRPPTTSQSRTSCATSFNKSRQQSARTNKQNTSSWWVLGTRNSVSVGLGFPSRLPRGLPVGTSSVWIKHPLSSSQRNRAATPSIR